MDNQKGHDYGSRRGLHSHQICVKQPWPLVSPLPFHIEMHQLESMALIINEALQDLDRAPASPEINTCGDFMYTASVLQKSQGHNPWNAGKILKYASWI